MSKTATATKTTAPTSITVELLPTKETKGTYVFGTDDEDAPVKSVYVAKSAMPDGQWKKLTLTLS